MKDDYIVGKFQVWHKHPEGFRHVATVNSNFMGAVIKPIAGPDHPLSKDVEYTGAWQRPTTLGDKLVDSDGLAFELYYDKQLEVVVGRETTHPQQDNFNRELDMQHTRPRQENEQQR